VGAVAMDENCTYLNDDLVRLAFGDLNPPLSRFSHVVFKADSASMRVVLDSVRQTGGIFGDYPLVDGSGEPYLVPEDGQIINDFVLWELPENQKALFEYGCYSKLDSFTMVINSRTSTALLSSLYLLISSGIGETESIFYYYNCIACVAEAITELGWAYIPLGDEVGYAMFVGGPGYEVSVNSVESILSESGVSCFRVRTGKARNMDAVNLKALND
jgi:hypothetical protein